MIGKVYTMQPQPPVAAHTTWLDAGTLSIGVEYRVLDPASLIETYKDDPAALAEMEANQPEGGFFDEGVSLHVRALADGHEYVRFDVFADEPHYHYVHPTGDANNVIDYDVPAHGPMLPWALECLRHRLGDMLTEAGGGHLVASLDLAAIERAVDEAERLAGAAGARR